MDREARWKDLAKPYRVPGLTLRRAGDTLLCLPTEFKAKPQRRPLGCVPTAIEVFTTRYFHAGLPKGQIAVVAIATCADGQGTQELAAVCGTRPR
jgi:hypothetical protein